MFYAIDSSGNIGSKKISFRIKKNSDAIEDDEPINYFITTNETVKTFDLTSNDSSFKWGPYLLFFLFLDILIIIFLIILIKRDLNESEEEVSDSDFFN